MNAIARLSRAAGEPNSFEKSFENEALARLTPIPRRLL
jgi:hypothetical protein